ncbi:conjugal transfer mating pair stabilization protein TraN [Halomonas sp. KO116]|uniref:conjugal transfer mating pair stabilization protein TraN n=1 Tax=Halomonas sp. KO116 TaxID=1504981 RepID=UPI0004E292A4|nr:conjugal transfer mating pair stabilization protein TraN [Halomonas sp. KO116]AJY53127.1 Type-F conjugative transfer system mating-pair stabilization protein TraN [Halomonas sp. KO116]
MEVSKRKHWGAVWLSWLLITLMVIQPAMLYADAFIDAARNGQGFADDIGVSGPANVDGGSISFGDGDAISVNDLFPDTASDTGKSYNYPHMRPQDELEGESSSDSGLSDVGSLALSNMRAEVTQSGGPTSIQGMAYEVVHKAGDLSRPDFSSDPMMNQSREVFDSMEDFANNFADCSVDESFAESSFSAHVPEYNQCIRRFKPEGNCRINHLIEIDTEPTDIVFLIDHTASMEPEIGALRYGLGNFVNLLSRGKSDNVRTGALAFQGDDHTKKAFQVPLSYNVDAVQKWVDKLGIEPGQTDAWKVVAYAADFFQWRENVNRVIVVIGNEDDGGDSGDRAAALNGISRNGLDVNFFHNNRDTASIANHVNDVFNNSTFMGFAQFFTVVNDSWGPQSCIDDAIVTQEEFCEGSYEAVPADGASCRNIDGFNVCPGDPIEKQLSNAPIPNVPRLASHVEVAPLSCNYDQGTSTCWEDINGEEQCLSSGDAIEECAEFEANPQCGYISTSCVDGAEGSEGNCYVQEETWDCGTSYEIPTIERESEYSCAGPIRCMGSECFEHEIEQSADFARASAMMNAAQNMVQDLSCSESSTGMSCTVFTGEAGECKRAVSGTVDCCEKPSGISMGDYLTMIMTVPKIDNAIVGLESDGPLAALKGSYQLLRDPITSGWSSVTQPFTSRIENVSGAWDAFSGSVKNKALELAEPLKEKVAEMTGDMIFNSAEVATGEGAAAVGSGEGAQSFSQQLLGEAGASYLGAAMTAYQIYVVTMLAIQLIWSCEAEEFELNAQRELKSCRHIGTYCKTEVLGYCIERRQSYCCFNSPLSRILQEEVRKQSGLSWGSAESPSCGGLPITALESINWDLVNLDEWLGILQSEGLYMGDGGFDLESLTGTNNHLNVDDRADAATRTLNRFEDVDSDAFRQKTQNELRSDFYD